MAAKTVYALTPIEHDGVDYAIGAAIKMEAEQAEALLVMGAASADKVDASTVVDEPVQTVDVA